MDKLDFFQKCIIGFEKFFLFWVPMNIQKDWKAKLESAYSFMLKYSKITVWSRELGHRICKEVVSRQMLEQIEKDPPVTYMKVFR